MPSSPMWRAFPRYDSTRLADQPGVPLRSSAAFSPRISDFSSRFAPAPPERRTARPPSISTRTGFFGTKAPPPSATATDPSKTITPSAV